jgi:DNA-binding ferritin-like protein
MWAAGTLLDAVDEIPTRSLDTSGKATASEIAAAIAESIKVQKDKFVEAEEIAERDVAAIESQVELLRKQYPSWVK